MTDFLCPNCGPITEDDGLLFGPDDSDVPACCAFCGCDEEEMKPLADAYATLEGRCERVEAELTKLHRLLECRFHGDDHAACEQYSGQVPCEHEHQSYRVPEQSQQALPNEHGQNRYGLDMAYFRNVINRDLNQPLDNHPPADFARMLARMAKTACSEVLAEPEFQQAQGKVVPVPAGETYLPKITPEIVADLAGSDLIEWSIDQWQWTQTAVDFACIIPVKPYPPAPAAVPEKLRDACMRLLLNDGLTEGHDYSAFDLLKARQELIDMLSAPAPGEPNDEGEQR